MSKTRFWNSRRLLQLHVYSGTSAPAKFKAFCQLEFYYFGHVWPSQSIPKAGG
jgi:hypothetical protein